MILKKYTNQLFNIIKEEGYSTDSFFAKHSMGMFRSNVFTLGYKTSPMKFIINGDLYSFDHFQYKIVHFYRGYPESSFLPAKKKVLFSEIAENFVDWLNKDLALYIEELGEIDLWGNMYKNSNNFRLESIDFNDESMFSKKEKEKIKLSLDEIEKKMTQSFNFVKAQIQTIADTLKYLKKAIERNNKTDWKGITISAILSLVIALNVDTSVGRQIWDLFRIGFNNITNFPL